MSNAVTVKNIKDYLVDNPGMLFYGWTGVTGVDWVDQYIAQHDTIDDILFRKYYSMFILDYGELCGSESNAIDAINAAACNELYNNKYKWDGLWESTILQFNPLWNVDADITETRTPDLKHTSGARTDYTDNKSYTDTNNNYSYPFDSAGTAKQTDKSELVRGAHKDGFEKGQQIDSETGTDTTHIIRQGNIGVTTSTQLLSEYRRFVAYSFWEQFMEAICEAVLIYQDDMEYLEVTGGGGGGGSVTVTATASATSVPSTDPATVSVTSSNNNLDFVFEIPEGAEGPEGPEGPPGQDGQSAQALTGVTDPIASLGNNGDIYVKTATFPHVFNYARMTITKNRSNAQYTQLAEVEFSTDADVNYEWTGTTVTSNVTYVSIEPPSNLIDGDLVTKYDTQTTPNEITPIILTFDLGSPLDTLTYNHFKWYTGYDAPERDPVTFKLELSTDGVDWYEVCNEANYNVTTARKALAYNQALHTGYEYIDTWFYKINDDWIK